jgi:hypothetical protein
MELKKCIDLFYIVYSDCLCCTRDPKYEHISSKFDNKVWADELIESVDLYLQRTINEIKK